MANITFNNSYAQLPDIFFSEIQPEKSPNPSLIRLNNQLAETLGVNVDWLSSDLGLAMLSGQVLPEDATPIAMVYAGHQFGNWTSPLGDGRALLIGEIIDKKGVRRDLHLKGSGKTAYSRNGDGKSALGPVLREYIVSEAMAALGVPTTRALAAVTTGETIYRDTPQQGAILTRVAQSHIRIGTFQYFYAQGDDKALKTLSDYVIERHYPEVKDTQSPYKELLNKIVDGQVILIAKWMSFGFIHGVMNTDNTQIAGETLDYGPCAFMDTFDPMKTFSAIDEDGRYAWANQPHIAQWNLARLAEAILPLLDPDPNIASQIAADAVNSFNSHFQIQFLQIFREKFGLLSDDVDYSALIEDTFETMAANNVDFTLFFRNLTRIAAGMPDTILQDLFDDPKACDTWLVSWRHCLLEDKASQDQSLKIMRERNPIFIPRNHQIEKALRTAENGDFSLFNQLIEILSNPFSEQPEHSEFEKAPLKSEIIHKTFCGT